MRIIDTYYTDEHTRSVMVNRKTDHSDVQFYGGVLKITKELDNEGRYYAVLHHDSGETSTFGLDEWEIRPSTFFLLWSRWT